MGRLAIVFVFGEHAWIHIHAHALVEWKWIPIAVPFYPVFSHFPPVLSSRLSMGKQTVNLKSLNLYNPIIVVASLFSTIPFKITQI